MEANETRFAYFYIDTFTSSAATAIIIDGIDTGITDFNYQGQPLSVILANVVSTAKNHGDYVCSVVVLSVKLVRAKLITTRQARSLVLAAAQSDIGKKPKKPKKDQNNSSKKGHDEDEDDD